ncbi:hypothetical protein [Paenibacillus alkalitolerans]|uniref:hypothetical protein n=1 Tax=Paenibacillus alkalitolerans TaxID=2799335 RepID=UPI0018F379F1|nr:hypothetical protein [Paenibacillus alkalitolerans]
MTEPDVKKLRETLQRFGIETEGLTDEELIEYSRKLCETFVWQVDAVMKQVRLMASEIMKTLGPLIDQYKKRQRRIKQLSFRKKRTQAKRRRH